MYTVYWQYRIPKLSAISPLSHIALFLATFCQAPPPPPPLSGGSRSFGRPQLDIPPPPLFFFFSLPQPWWGSRPRDCVYYSSSTCTRGTAIKRPGGILVYPLLLLLLLLLLQLQCCCAIGPMCKGSNSSSSNNGILEFGMCARGGGCSIGGQYHTSIGKARDIELLSVRSRKASDPQKKGQLEPRARAGSEFHPYGPNLDLD